MRSRFPEALLLLCALAAASRADRPVLPDPPLGTSAAAFAGGGAGQVSGVNAIFTNPGALSIPAGFQVEAGMMGLSQGASPYTLAGGRAEGGTWAAGYFYDTRMGPFRNGMVAGAAREVLPGLTLGAAGRSVGGAEGFGVDADAGLLFRPRGLTGLGDWAVVGLSARNLLESGVGQEPGGYETPRSYALSLGARRERARFLLLPVREPDAAYEFSARGFDPAGLAHTFSAGAAFTPSGTLGLRATLRLPHEGAALIAFGGFLHFPVGAGALRCGYAFSTGGLATGLGMPVHSVSLNLALGTRRDRLPPRVAVRADRVFLGAGPEAAGGSGARFIHFRLHASDRLAAGQEGADAVPAADAATATATEAAAKAPGPGEGLGAEGDLGELGEWALTLCATGADGRERLPVKTFQGKDLPPRLIRWDGRDEAGRALPPGFYAFRLSARDKAGNLGETPWQLVEIASGAGGSGAETAGGPAREPGATDPARPAMEALPPILEGDDG